jgi:DNA-binding transcriptional regulator YiaG
MANMFDFAIHDSGIPADDFAQMFAGSQICRSLEKGEPKYIIGMCGEELALRIIEETTGIAAEAEIEEKFDRTPDHWCGWVIAYYQWLRGISFSELFDVLPYSGIYALYRPLHEADVSKFAEAMDEIRAEKKRETNLKRIRSAYGCSQSELARMSNVSLRSIQMYEQRQKDINKGQASTIMNLAKALGCSMEALLEY